MHVHEFFDLSIMVGTGVILFLIMQFLDYAVVRYLNPDRRSESGLAANLERFEAGSPFRNRQLVSLIKRG